MSDFKHGDKVLIRATVHGGRDADGKYSVTTDIGGHGLYLPAADLELEMVPGMALMSEDAGDRRIWYYLPDEVMDHPFRGKRGWYSRVALPDQIRVVFDPREVTS